MLTLKRIIKMNTLTLKRFSIAALLTVIFAMPVMANPWNIGAESNPGGAESITATLSEDGTLTISGTGEMMRFFWESMPPWYDSRRSITNVVIENGVTTISRYTFYSSGNLISVTIPNSVTDIDNTDGAFLYCYNLTLIDVAADNIYYSSQDGVLFNKDKTRLLAYPQNKQGTSYTIPNGVTTIVSNAFRNCRNLSAITIPNSVTVISNNAFYQSNLASITIPNSVTTIGASAFLNCRSLTYVTIPSGVTTIDASAFNSCRNLTAINVSPDNANYSSEDGILFNKDRTTLIFYPGGKQGVYTIPNGVTTIGNSAFMGGNDNLVITIPNSVTRIESSAFYYSRLRSITIPSSVTSIGGLAFSGCHLLMSVISLNPTPPSTQQNPNNTFSNTASNICLYVPQASIEAYADWKDFTCIRSIDELRTVTFNSLGGSIITPQTVGLGNKALKPTDPTRPNYVFEGWYQDIAYTLTWYFDTDVVSSDMTLYARWSPAPVSVLSFDRIIPSVNPMPESSTTASVNQLVNEFTVGPNPVNKQSGDINFFWQGNRIQNATLTVFNASGNVINKVKITDSALNTPTKRIIGSWDLADKRGRLVSDGTYLVRGVVITYDGKRERVSVMVGVR